MIFPGFEGWYANRDDLDISTDNLMDMQGDKIIVVNLNPKPINMVWLYGRSRDEAIEYYKYIIANCSIITIFLNEDKTLKELEVA